MAEILEKEVGYKKISRRGLLPYISDFASRLRAIDGEITPDEPVVQEGETKYRIKIVLEEV